MMLAGDVHLGAATPNLAGLAKLDLFAIDSLDVRFAFLQRGAALFAAHAAMVGVRLVCQLVTTILQLFLGGILLGAVQLDVALCSTMVADEILVSWIHDLVVATIVAILQGGI